MKILLQGAETNNKGAELMLYAVLQEIERSYPDSIVYLRKSCVRQGRKYLLSNVNIKLFFSPLAWVLFNRLRINEFLKKLHINKAFVPNPPSGNIDYYLDMSGLLFSDQRNLTDDRIDRLSVTLKKYAQSGMKIVYLPQAFGPLEKTNTKRAISILSNNASLIFAREPKSYEYLKNSGLADMNKIKICTDFTSLVNGTFPENYNRLKGAVCIIPNQQMIARGGLTFEDYVEVLSIIIATITKNGYKAFFLNHEGFAEELFIKKIISQPKCELELVTGLNALETKGIIAESYLVISSRFHGVASALNSCVPCLATSWNHKYACLFEDYGQHDCVLNQMNRELVEQKITEFLNPDVNSKIRTQLKQITPTIQQYAKDMWKTIWNLS